MPQNKIKNPFSSISNKDPNFLKSDLFQFGMDEGIPRNQNVIQNARMILQNSRTPKTELSPIGLPDLPEPESETESIPQDDNQSRFLASLLGQGAAMFGGAIAGRDPMKIAEQFSGERLLQDRMAQAREQEQYTRGERELLKQEQNRIRIANEEQRKLAIEQAKNLMNPDSEESKRKRLVYERALGIKIPGEFSASDLEDRNVLQGLVAQSQPKPVPGRVGGGVQKKESLAKNPFYKEIILTSNMGNSVDSDLKELSDLIKKSGNTPLIGPDKLRQQQLVNQIAINYNKILDPSSVVREAESGAVIKNLGLEWLTRSDVSKEAIDQFRNSVDRTVNNNIKGYYGMYSTFSPEEEQIAEDFKNNPNDPKISEAYSNLLSLKRKGVKL